MYCTSYATNVQTSRYILQIQGKTVTLTFISSISRLIFMRIFCSTSTKGGYHGLPRSFSNLLIHLPFFYKLKMNQELYHILRNACYVLVVFEQFCLIPNHLLYNIYIYCIILCNIYGIENIWPEETFPIVMWYNERYWTLGTEEKFPSRC